MLIQTHRDGQSSGRAATAAMNLASSTSWEAFSGRHHKGGGRREGCCCSSTKRERLRLRWPEGKGSEKDRQREKGGVGALRRLGHIPEAVDYSNVKALATFAPLPSVLWLPLDRAGFLGASGGCSGSTTIIRRPRGELGASWTLASAFVCVDWTDVEGADISKSKFGLCVCVPHGFNT